MKLIGIMPVRNEDWVIGLSARAVLLWADELVVLDHASTDLTGGILRRIEQEEPGRISVIREARPRWDEMTDRQRLLNTARERGATHIATVDADEVLTANLVPDIREMIEECARYEVFQLWMPCMWRSLWKYRFDTSVWSRVFASTAFMDDPALSWKPRGNYHFHHRHPHGPIRFRSPMAGKRGPQQTIRGGLMHLQFVRWKALVAKHAYYKMVEVTRWTERDRGTVATVNQKYNQALNENGLHLEPAPGTWWDLYREKNWLEYLNLEATGGWREKACKEMWARYGPERFRELDLFGVVG